MTFKPDILEKSESLIEKVNKETLPKINSTMDNINGITKKVNNSILCDVQDTLKEVNGTLSKINKILPLVVVALSLVAVAAVGTFAGVLVLLFR